MRAPLTLYRQRFWTFASSTVARLVCLAFALALTERPALAQYVPPPAAIPVCVENCPPPPSSRQFEVGVRDVQIGRYDDAVQALRQAVAQDPTNASVYNALGIAYFYVGRWDDWLKMMQRAYALTPDTTYARDQVIRAYLGAASASLKKHDRAAAATFSKAALAVKGDLPTRNMFFDLYDADANDAWDRNDYASVIGDYQAALTIDPTDTATQENLTGAYFNLALSLRDKPDQAIKLFKVVLARDPSNAKAQFRLGEAYLLSHDYANAVTALQPLLDSGKADAVAYSAAAFAYYSLGKNAAAEQIAAAALALNPSDERAQTVINRVREQRRRTATQQDAAAGSQARSRLGAPQDRLVSVQLTPAASDNLRAVLAGAPRAKPPSFQEAVARTRTGFPVLGDIWFRAYLEERPEAPNAPLVRKLVAELESGILADRDKLLADANASLANLPTDHPRYAALKADLATAENEAHGPEADLLTGIYMPPLDLVRDEAAMKLPLARAGVWIDYARFLQKQAYQPWRLRESVALAMREKTATAVTTQLHDIVDWLTVYVVHTQRLARLLDWDAPKPDAYRRTALHLAAASVNITQVRKLIASRADVNARDDDDQTPLHAALEYVPSQRPLFWSERPSTEVVKALVDVGANVNARDRWGRTPLILASAAAVHSPDEFARRGETDRRQSVELLLAHGARANDKSKGGSGALAFAVDARTAIDLLEHGADPNERSRQPDATQPDISVFEYWVLKNAPDVVGALVHAGVDLNAKSRFGGSLADFVKRTRPALLSSP